MQARSRFYLRFIVWRRRAEYPKVMSFVVGSGGVPPPGNFLKLTCAEIQSVAFCETILINVTVVFYF